LALTTVCTIVRAEVEGFPRKAASWLRNLHASRESFRSSGGRGFARRDWREFAGESCNGFAAADLTFEEAHEALAQLQPVEFNYKNDQQEKYVGFIAEDVPALVASGDRQSLSTMDIVAVLTKVVQEQQKQIAELEARLEQR
jgi:hypothetical protein